MQRVKACRYAHEFAVEPRDPAATHARVGIFEHGHAARSFEPDYIGDERRVDALDLRAFDIPAQRLRHVIHERGETLSHGGPDLLAGMPREDQRADRT